MGGRKNLQDERKGSSAKERGGGAKGRKAADEDDDEAAWAAQLAVRADSPGLRWHSGGVDALWLG